MLSQLKQGHEPALLPSHWRRGTAMCISSSSEITGDEVVAALQQNPISSLPRTTVAIGLGPGPLQRNCRH